MRSKISQCRLLIFLEGWWHIVNIGGLWGEKHWRKKECFLWIWCLLERKITLRTVCLILIEWIGWLVDNLCLQFLNDPVWVYHHAVRRWRLSPYWAWYLSLFYIDIIIWKFSLNHLLTLLFIIRHCSISLIHTWALALLALLRRAKRCMPHIFCLNLNLAWFCRLIVYRIDS